MMFKATLSFDVGNPPPRGGFAGFVRGEPFPLNLFRLSLVSILTCLAGLVLLLVVTVGGIRQIRDNNAAETGLLEMQARIDEFNSASDRLLLTGADEDRWRHYRSEAKAIGTALGRLGERHPKAGQAAETVSSMFNAVSTALGAPQTGIPEPGRAIAPLEAPEANRAVMSRVAELGAELDTALHSALRERRNAIASQTGRIGFTLGGAALLFGLLCILAFWMMHWRIARPARAISQTLAEVRSGRSDARVSISGSDELARVGQTLNALLDEQRAALQMIEERQRHLESALTELGETRDRLLRAQRVANIGHWEADLESGRLEWSDQVFEIFGTNRADFGGTEAAFFDLVHPDDREWLARARAAWLEQGGDLDAEHRIMRPDGRVLWVHERARILPGPDGRPRRTVGTVQDMTARHRIDARLRQFRELLENSDDLCGILDDDLRFVWANRAYARWFGMRPEQIEHRPIAELLGREHFESTVKPQIERCLAGEPQQFETRRQHPELGERRLLIRYSPIDVAGESGRNVGFVITDITEMRAAESKLAHQAQLLDIAGRAARLGGWSVDLVRNTIEWSDVTAEIHQMPAGYSPSVEEGISFYAPEYRDRVRELFSACVDHGRPYDEDLQIIDATGQRRWVRAVGEAVRGADGAIVGVQGAFQDITENHRMIEQLEAQDAALRDSRDALDAALRTRQAMINSLPAHIAMLDAESIVVDVNDQWRHFGEQNDSADEAFGVGSNYLSVCDAATGECGEEAALAAEGLREVLSGQKDSFALEYPCHAPDQPRWFRVVFNRLLPAPGQQVGAVAMHVDITERKLAEQELSRLAYTDPLTGLSSRNGFERDLRHRFAHGGWRADSFVAMLDVVNLRDINDSQGFETGDRLLIELGRRLQARTGGAGLAGRTGGDEFVVYVAPGAGETSASVLQQFERITEEPFELAGSAIEIELRIGYTELGDRQRPPEDLMREAELALSENRENLEARRRRVRYSEAIAKRTLQRIRLNDELRHALEAEEFELHFQPKVNLADGSMISAEALLRWHHPERGLQPPGLFIPIAERSQLIGPIGDWALREACRQVREWRDAGLAIVRISVNVSLVQFQLGGFPARVRAALEDYDIAPSELSLEITESVFESHSDQLLAEIRELHDLGVRLSLDDFGTGYSSLQYLNRYPFDEVKIDRAFVSGLLDEHYSRDIVRSVMSVADALGAEVVAEGIESPAIAIALRELGCETGQGFYYSMPLEAEDFRWLLENHSTLPLDEGARDAARRPNPR